MHLELRIPIQNDTFSVLPLQKYCRIGECSEIIIIGVAPVPFLNNNYEIKHFLVN